MNKVKNQKVVERLSVRSLRSARLRNLVAVCAIALTTIMFTTLFTIGGSLLSTMQEATMRQVGTRAHGGFKFMTEEQYEQISKDKKIKDISYNIIIGLAENPELNKVCTEIRYTEKKAAEWGYCMPTTGELPEKKYDIATTTNVLDALGVPHKLGEKVTLEFTVKGQKISQEFTLCGFWEADVALGVSEAFVSREYCDEVAPVLHVPLYEQEEIDTINMYAGSVNPSLWFATSWDIEGQMDALMERCGLDKNLVNPGVNWGYATMDVDAGSIMLVVFVLLLVLLSGYLIIYNIFSISVTRDIHFYGLLKTIGTTGRQLKRIVRRQAFLLCIIGIPVGLAAGYFCGAILMPIIMKTTTIAISMVISPDPFIFIGAALFALLTVWISCIRPCKIAASVSPVEAVRFTGIAQIKKKRKKSRKVSSLSMAMAQLARERKKAVLVVLSLSLSLILLNGTYILVHGFDMDKFLNNLSVTDFLLEDATLRSGFIGAEEMEGVSDRLRETVSELPGVKDQGCVWAKENVHVLSDAAWERTQEIVEKNKGEFAEKYIRENLRMLKEAHSIFSHIYGVDASILPYIGTDGEGGFHRTQIDTEKFASGDYVIATAFWSDGRDAYYEPGDQVTLDFGNGKQKTYTVLEIGDIPYAMGPQHSHMIDVYFILPGDEFERQYGKTQPLCTTFNVEPEYREQTEQWAESYCEDVESNMTYTSKGTYEKEFQNEKNMFAIVGGTMGGILGLIGILNFVNAMITSIAARKQELAMLQSVGMTGKQVKRMLMGEGFIYITLTVGIALSVGSLICFGLIRLISLQIWFISYHFSVTPVLIATPILGLMALLVPLTGYHSISKQSVVERLRETE